MNRALKEKGIQGAITLYNQNKQVKQEESVDSEPALIPLQSIPINENTKEKKKEVG